MNRQPRKTVSRRRMVTDKTPLLDAAARPRVAEAAIPPGSPDRPYADLVTIGFVTLDRMGRIIDLNERAARLLGFGREWLRNRPFVVFVAKDDVDRFLRLLMNSARDSQHRIVELDLAIGNQILPVVIALAAFPGDNVTYQMEIVDRIEEKKKEVELRQTLEQWNAVLVSAPDNIMTVDKTGRIVFINTPLWGYSAAALVGTNLYDYVSADSRAQLRRCMHRAFRWGKASICEIELMNADSNSTFQFNFGGVTVRNVDGTTTTLVIRDITKEKRAEEMLLTSAEQLRNLTARVEAIREEERTNLAREIHDELGQALTVLKLDIASVQRNIDGSDAGKKLEEIITHVDHTIERVRSIASALRPSILDHFGLQAAIEWQASLLQKRTGIQVKTSSAGVETDLPPEISIAAFRMVQEALTNVIRHAQASRVKIRVTESRQRLRIFIADDGQGMSREKFTDVKSLGILGMKERAVRLGGHVSISSLPGRGTRLNIVIPLRRDRDSTA